MNVWFFRFLLISMLWLEYTWETYLLLRQHRKLITTKELDNKLLQVVLEDTIEPSRQYSIRCCRFKFVVQLVSAVVSTVVLSTSFLYVMWDFSHALNLFSSEVTTSCIWQTIVSFIAKLLELPLVAYEVFALQESSGFGYRCVHKFLADLATDFWNSQVFNIIITSVMILIVRMSGRHFVFWLYLAIGFLSLFLIVSFTLDPLLDENHALLPKGQLRKDLQALVAQAEFPLDEIYLTNSGGHTRNSVTIHGIPNTRHSIVLTERLIRWRALGRGCSDDEIVGIVAHELGHWHHKHAMKQFLANQVDMLVTLLLFSTIFHTAVLYEVVGFKEEQPVVVAVLIFFGYVLRPYRMAFNFLMNHMSRRFELQADNFAADLGRGAELSSALIQQLKNNLTFPVCDPLYSKWYHSHPQLIERLENLERMNRDLS